VTGLYVWVAAGVKIGYPLRGQVAVFIAAFS
jgi:hypothetical protein